MKKKVFLVTTGIQETLINNKKIDTVLAGSWCKALLTNKIIKKNTFINLPYHWEDEKKKKRDAKYIQKIYKLFLPEITLKLNKLHNKEYSKKYWETILSPWLEHFIITIFDRYSTIKQIQIFFDVVGTKSIIFNNEEELTPRDINEAKINFMISEYWNHYIYSYLAKKILKIKNVKHLHINAKLIKQTFKINGKEKIKSFLKNKIIYFIDTITRPFNLINNKIFVLSTYLGFFAEFLFNLKSNKILRFNRPILFKKNYKLRLNIRNFSFDKIAKDEFTRILSGLIPKNIPKYYIEGFNDIQKEVKNLPWPKKPKAIFTSTGQHIDELFKFWSAAKQEEYSTPLVFGQHGGGFLSEKYDVCHNIEIEKASFFLSWGKKNLSSKFLGLYNIVGQFKKLKHNKRGKLNIVQYTSSPYTAHCASTVKSFSQYENNILFQKSFINNLDEKYHSRTKIRLGNTNKCGENIQNFEKKVWTDKKFEIKLEDRDVSKYRSIEESRLVVYNDLRATLFLETISMNIPSILFIKDYKTCVPKKFLKLFHQLEKVGIIHVNPKKLATFINENFDNIEDWWNKEKVQKVKKIFCDNFSFHSKNPIKDLSKTILSSTTEH